MVYFHILLESPESVPGNSCVIKYTERRPLENQLLTEQAVFIACLLARYAGITPIKLAIKQSKA